MSELLLLFTSTLHCQGIFNRYLLKRLILEVVEATQPNEMQVTISGAA